MPNQKKIDETIASIEKLHGKNAVIKLGSSSRLDVPVIPTGIISVDAALGIGGFPRGRIVEVYGPESGGKTTMTLMVAAQAQAMGDAVAFIDAEHALDPVYARKLGVDTGSLYVSQPDSGEQALEIAEWLIKSSEFGVVIVDSVAALVPKKELEGEMGDAQMGLQARLMSQAMRKLTGVTSHTRTCLIFINQIREKIGVLFGNPETTTGGRALKFYASIRMDVRKSAPIKDGDIVIGVQSKIKIAKNNLASPFREAAPDMIFGQGFCQARDLVRFAAEPAVAILEKSGTWFNYKGERLGQGLDNATDFLNANPVIAAKIMADVRKKIFTPEEKKA